MIVIDLENVYNKVSRVLFWWAMSKKGIPYG